MRVLDEHINQLQKNVYYFVKNEVNSHNGNVMEMLRGFNYHENSELIVRNCNRLFDESDARRLEKQGRAQDT